MLHLVGLSLSLFESVGSPFLYYFFLEFVVDVIESDGECPTFGSGDLSTHGATDVCVPVPEFL